MPPGFLQQHADVAARDIWCRRHGWGSFRPGLAKAWDGNENKGIRQ